MQCNNLFFLLFFLIVTGCNSLLKPQSLYGEPPFAVRITEEIDYTRVRWEQNDTSRFLIISNYKTGSSWRSPELKERGDDVYQQFFYVDSLSFKNNLDNSFGGAAKPFPISLYYRPPVPCQVFKFPVLDILVAEWRGKDLTEKFDLTECFVVSHMEYRTAEHRPVIGNAVYSVASECAVEFKEGISIKEYLAMKPFCPDYIKLRQVSPFPDGTNIGHIFCMIELPEMGNGDLRYRPKNIWMQVE